MNGIGHTSIQGAVVHQETQAYLKGCTGGGEAPAIMFLYYFTLTIKGCLNKSPPHSPHLPHRGIIPGTVLWKYHMRMLIY